MCKENAIYLSPSRSVDFQRFILSHSCVVQHFSQFRKQHPTWSAFLDAVLIVFRCNLNILLLSLFWKLSWESYCYNLNIMNWCFRQIFQIYFIPTDWLNLHIEGYVFEPYVYIVPFRKLGSGFSIPDITAASTRFFMEGVSASTETQGLLRDDINDTIQPRIQPLRWADFQRYITFFDLSSTKKVKIGRFGLFLFGSIFLHIFSVWDASDMKDSLEAVSEGSKYLWEPKRAKATIKDRDNQNWRTFFTCSTTVI